MTRAEIEASALEFLTPEQASEVLGCKPYAINTQAQANPAMLGVPVCVMGSRVRIPRRAFLRWLEGGSPRAMTDEQVRAEFDRLRNWMEEQMEIINERKGDTGDYTQ